MSEWPVVIVEEFDDVQRGEVAPGDEVAALWAKISGVERAAIWIICPRCGTLGDCPVVGTPHAGEAGRGWTVEESSGKLTMRPSILCQSGLRLDSNGNLKRRDEPCGGHYFLANGILREV